MDLSMYAALISSVLLVALTVVVLRIYRDTRAPFTLGLLIFGGILFVQNLITVFSFAMMAQYIGEPFLPFLFTINVFQVLGLVVLLRTTMQ